MKKPTLQELFDKVLNHSRQMTEQSISDDETCRYRNPNNGNKCFVGALISDDLYEESMEENDVGGLVDLGFCTGELSFIEDFENELNELQRIHDCLFDRREEELEKFSIKHKLNFLKLS